MHQGALSHTRDRYRLRTRHLRGHADGVLETPIEAKTIAHLRLARELLAAERQEQLRMRDNGAISDALMRDRKSTRLNSSHGYISYAVFCLKKKKPATAPGALLRS